MDLGYDLFDAIMNAREIQAENMAKFVHSKAATETGVLPIYIHGKAYKPDVTYLEGSYSLLVGHFLEQMGAEVHYIDPLTEPDVPRSVYGVILLAHNKQITYGYAGVQDEQQLYCSIEDGSIVIDPWRKFASNNDNITVIHYDNTRKK